MAQMNISLPDGLKTWAEQRVADGDYSSTSDYVRDLMRRDRSKLAQTELLRTEIEKGLASGTSQRGLKEIYDDNRARREAA